MYSMSAVYEAHVQYASVWQSSFSVGRSRVALMTSQMPRVLLVLVLRIPTSPFFAHFVRNLLILGAQRSKNNAQKNLVAMMEQRVGRQQHHHGPRATARTLD
jgi:hypothetical protein